MANYSTYKDKSSFYKPVPITSTFRMVLNNWYSHLHPQNGCVIYLPVFTNKIKREDGNPSLFILVVSATTSYDNVIIS